MPFQGTKLSTNLRLQRKQYLTTVRRLMFKQIGKVWKEYVRFDVRFIGRKPSPRSMLRSRRKGATTIELGWIDYKGGKVAAVRRFNLRWPIFIKLADNVSQNVSNNLERLIT